MTDIVERLREGEDGLEYAAADEIERLRGRVAVYEIDTADAEHEIEQLRAKLEAVEMELARAVVQITGLEYRGG